jgi:hypothetical protein
MSVYTTFESFWEINSPNVSRAACEHDSGTHIPYLKNTGVVEKFNDITT